LALACSFRSFVRVRDVNPGFNPRNVLTLELTMASERYKDKDAVLAGLFVSFGSGWKTCRVYLSRASHRAVEPDVCWDLSPSRTDTAAGREVINAMVRMVSGHYFQAMEIPVREGRLFSDHDVAKQNPRGDVDDYMAATTLAKPGPDWASAFISGVSMRQALPGSLLLRSWPGEAIQLGLGLAHRVLPSTTQYVTRA